MRPLIIVVSFGLLLWAAVATETGCNIMACGSCIYDETICGTIQQV